MRLSKPFLQDADVFSEFFNDCANDLWSLKLYSMTFVRLKISKDTNLYDAFVVWDVRGCCCRDNIFLLVNDGLF